MRKFFTRTNRLSNTTKTKMVGGKSEIEDNADQGRTGPILEINDQSSNFSSSLPIYRTITLL